MRLKNSALAFALAVVAGFGLTRCGDTGTGATTCTKDADCTGTGQVCHLTAKQCVKTCDAAVDCPSEAKTCTTAPFATGATPKICQCSTDALCGTGKVCSTVDKICATKCTSDTDCGGRKCDTATGQCGGGGGTCSWSNCSTSSFTAAGQQCNGGSCGAGPACSGAGQSTCANNSYCASSVCGLPVYPTQAACQNFYSGGRSGPTWNPASSTGPVIYSITEVSHGAGQATTGACPSTSSEAGNCQCNPTETQWNIRVLAYRNDMAWPATRAGLSGFKYVKADGTDLDVIGMTLLRPQTGYENGVSATDKQFNLYFCGSNANAFQPGFLFTGGNESCRQF